MNQSVHVPEVSFSSIKSSQLDDFLSGSKEPSWYKDIRRAAFDRMLKASPLRFKHGLSINLQPEGVSSSLFTLPTKCPMLTIQELTSNGLRMQKTIPAALRKAASALLLDENRSCDQLHYFTMCFGTAVSFLTLPARSKVDGLYDVSHLLNDAVSTLVIHARKGTSGKLKVVSESGKPYTTVQIIAILEDGAVLEILTYQRAGAQTFSALTKVAYVGTAAAFRTTDIVLGGCFTRNLASTILAGEGAVVKNKVLYLATGQTRHDVVTEVVHRGCNTISDIATRGVLAGNSKGLSRGLIKIEPTAALSNGYEKQDTLLLSDGAEGDAIPNLEILNNDVKCSHGSTIGQIDEEKVFYLMSRGFHREEAVKTIVTGYFNAALAGMDEREQESIIEAIRGAL